MGKILILPIYPYIRSIKTKFFMTTTQTQVMLQSTNATVATAVSGLNAAILALMAAPPQGVPFPATPQNGVSILASGLVAVNGASSGAPIYTAWATVFYNVTA